ncbi:MAG: hypothetical protein GXO43_05810 [Crenarchaeota archaeon]|nr:hypothetical protein [Thermoproteota archaeon]
MRIIWIIILIILTIIAGAIIDLVATANNGIWHVFSLVGIKPLPGFNPNGPLIWAMFVGVIGGIVFILYALIVASSIRERTSSGW